MAIDINYKGKNIASLGDIKTAVIECAGKKMTDDLTIIVTETGGGGECSGNHIIEVDELPEVGVEGAVYWANTFTDVFLQEAEDKLLFSQLAKTENIKVYLGDFLTNKGSDGLNRPDGYDAYLYYLPIKVEELEALYSTPNIFMGTDDGGYSPLSQLYNIPFKGEITDISQATEDGYYAYMSIVFYQYTNGEFKKLTAENIDTTALYKVGESYYRYVDGAFTDIIVVENGTQYSLLALYSALLGITPDLYAIKTKPTTEEELSEIVASDLNAGVMALYYIEDEVDVFAYMDSAWNPLGANGVIGDASEATADGMYILVGSYWAKYISPSGSIAITKNSTVDVTDKKSVIVNVPQPSGTVTITENGTYDVTEYGSAYVNVPQPNGNIEITTNGTHDVTNYVSAEVGVPTTYMVQSVADLPTDAPIGSIAYVLGGE